jgi:hypothetical protein
MQSEERNMARPRKIIAPPTLSPGEATYVLERLIADRRITASEIQRYVAAMHQEIADLEQRLRTLRLASSSTVSFQGSPQSVERTPPTVQSRRRRPQKTASAEVRASRQLQGRYVSLIRQIPKYKRGQFQKIAKDRGREDAVAELRSFLGK